MSIPKYNAAEFDSMFRGFIQDVDRVIAMNKAQVSGEGDRCEAPRLRGPQNEREIHPLQPQRHPESCDIADGQLAFNGTSPSLSQSAGIQIAYDEGGSEVGHVSDWTLDEALRAEKMQSRHGDRE